MLKQIKLSKIKEFFGKLPRILGERAFLTSLLFIFLALILGGIIFYKYSILAQKVEPQIIEKPLQFKENLYQKVLEKWENRQKKFEETELREYPNPFQGSISAPEELTD